ncbi:MAG: hypothetical protein EOP38_12500 [Rubrivivax sp.]|nr:MAG: hypothetical protein EOP38_12500 [Rubrivivax sp.]
MNARQFLSQPKALAATALLALTGAANAGGVYWSVGVNAPIPAPGRVHAVVGNGGYYGPQPVVYAQPTPVLIQQPIYYAPQPVVYQAPRWEAPRMGWRERHWHHHHGAYARGYQQGYEQGRGDDRRGGWDRR